MWKKIVSSFGGGKKNKPEPTVKIDTTNSGSPVKTAQPHNFKLDEIFPYKIITLGCDVSTLAFANKYSIE